MFFMTKIQVHDDTKRKRLECRDGNDKMTPIIPVLTTRHVEVLQDLAGRMTEKEWATLQLALKKPNQWQAVPGA